MKSHQAGSSSSALHSGGDANFSGGVEKRTALFAIGGGLSRVEHSLGRGGDQARLKRPACQPRAVLASCIYDRLWGEAGGREYASGRGAPNQALLSSQHQSLNGAGSLNYTYRQCRRIFDVDAEEEESDVEDEEEHDASDPSVGPVHVAGISLDGHRWRAIGFGERDLLVKDERRSNGEVARGDMIGVGRNSWQRSAFICALGGTPDSKTGDSRFWILSWPAAWQCLT
ncbi:hypothetical protein K438DRAFT_1756807 [Mycena galopus ATCC 62051]|nr:hypothetical protein K438DRAFT_1756807 [Mycena galopus ATCC 62051]